MSRNNGRARPLYLTYVENVQRQLTGPTETCAANRAANIPPMSIKPWQAARKSMLDLNCGRPMDMITMETLASPVTAPSSAKGG